MIIGMLEFEDMDNDLANEVSLGTHDCAFESESHGWCESIWTFLLGGWIVSRWFRSDAQKEQEPIFENNEAGMGGGGRYAQFGPQSDQTGSQSNMVI